MAARYRRYVYEAGEIDRSDKMQAKVIDDKVVGKNAKMSSKSAEAIDSGTAPAILQTRASLVQRSLCLTITSDLNIYFTQSTKKNQNLLKAWMRYIR